MEAINMDFPEKRFKYREKNAISRIVLHCSDTKSDPNIGVNEIRSWHKDRGFLDIGYHYVIRTDGSIDIGRDVMTVGAHCKGFNDNSIGICLVGGRDNNNEPDITGNWLTPQQCQMLTVLVMYLCSCFPVTDIVGHNELNSKKSCPNFDVIPFKKFIYGELQRN